MDSSDGCRTIVDVVNATKFHTEKQLKWYVSLYIYCHNKRV